MVRAYRDATITGTCPVCGGTRRRLSRRERRDRHSTANDARVQHGFGCPSRHPDVVAALGGGW